MKKIISLILAATIISLMIAQTAAFAETLKTKPRITHETTLIATDYQPTIIPKPKNIPGPTITSLEDAKNNAAQRIFGEKILPRFAIGTIAIVGAVSMLFIVIGGVRFATAYGNDETIENAKKEVIWALVAFLLALLSYTIVYVITNLDYVKIPANNQTTPPTGQTQTEQSSTTPAETPGDYITPSEPTESTA